MILIPFPLLLIEVLLFIFFWRQFGFLPVFAAYWLPSVFGMLILSLQSRATLFELQARLRTGQPPGFALINVAAKFISGLLFLPPLLSTRVLAILLFLPGARHLLLFFGQAWLMKKLAKGGFGRMGKMGGFTARFEEDACEEREVIDVTPIEISERSKPSGAGDGEPR